MTSGQDMNASIRSRENKSCKKLVLTELIIKMQKEQKQLIDLEFTIFMFLLLFTVTKKE